MFTVLPFIVHPVFYRNALNYVFPNNTDQQAYTSQFFNSQLPTEKSNCFSHHQLIYIGQENYQSTEESVRCFQVLGFGLEVSLAWHSRF